MSDVPPPAPDTERHLGGEGPPGLPRWVLISLIVLGVLVVVLVVAMLAGGNHGPGRHMGAPALGSVSVR